MPNPMRQRQRRPILSAMKNPCSGEREPNPPHGGGGHHGGGGRGFGGFGWPVWGWGGWGGWGGGWPYAYGGYPYGYGYAAQASNVWLPATKGPAPAGASVWIVWNGGSTGTKVYANSAISEQVQILETAKGGSTGTLVRTGPVIQAAPVYRPAIAPVYGYGYPTAIAVRRF